MRRNRVERGFVLAADFGANHGAMISNEGDGYSAYQPYVHGGAGADPTTGAKSSSRGREAVRAGGVAVAGGRRSTGGGRGRGCRITRSMPAAPLSRARDGGNEPPSWKARPHHGAVAAHGPPSAHPLPEDPQAAGSFFVGTRAFPGQALGVALRSASSSPRPIERLRAVQAAPWARGPGRGASSPPPPPRGHLGQCPGRLVLLRSSGAALCGEHAGPASPAPRRRGIIALCSPGHAGPSNQWMIQLAPVGDGRLTEEGPAAAGSSSWTGMAALLAPSPRSGGGLGEARAFVLVAARPQGSA